MTQSMSVRGLLQNKVCLVCLGSELLRSRCANETVWKGRLDAPQMKQVVNYTQTISFFSNAIATSLLSDFRFISSLCETCRRYGTYDPVYGVVYSPVATPSFATCQAKNLDVEIPPYLHPFCIAERWPSWIFFACRVAVNLQDNAQNKWDEQHDV